MGKKEHIAIDEIKQITDKRAIKKMQKISKEIEEGKRKLISLEEVKKKYGFK